jgi:Protein of unknown function (DUF2764)
MKSYYYLEKNYYYLAIVLPKLSIDEKPEMPFYEFVTLLKENLTPNDYDKTRRMRWLYDLRNIRAFWRHQPLDYWGNLNEVQLEDALLTREDAELPSYFFDFLDEYDTKEGRLEYFPKIMSQYFASEAETGTGFIKALRTLERNLILIITAYRARMLNRSLEQEFQFEDPEDALVSQLLAKKESKEFEAPEGFEGIKVLLDQNYSHPTQMQKAVIGYVFNWIEDALEFDYFSINRILGYMAQYILIERLMRLDKEKGLNVLNNIVKEVS